MLHHSLPGLLVVTGLSLLTLALSGSVRAGELGWVGLQQDGSGTIQGLDKAFGAVVSPDGAHLYVTGTVDDALTVFERSRATGRLSLLQQKTNGLDGVSGLDGATGVAASLDGRHLYVTAALDDALVVFARDSATGLLSFVEAIRDKAEGVEGLKQAIAVAVSPDGAHVYVAPRGDPGVSVFDRDPTTGALEYIELAHPTGFAWTECNDVKLSPDGLYVYATSGPPDDAVAVFKRDPKTGELGFRSAQQDGVNGVDGLGGANAVALSPDGEHAYVVGNADDAVAVFDRDAASGALTYVEFHRDGDTADGLDGANWVSLAPDGGHVYVSGFAEDAVAVFGRDAASGELTFVEVARDETAGVDGIDGASTIAVAPDGRHLYVTGEVDDAVAIFATAVLDFVRRYRDGVEGVEGLLGASAVTVSPGGAHVYATGEQDDALAAFRRDPETGLLTFIEAEEDGVNGVAGLDGAQSVAVAPDGEQVYVASLANQAAAVFSRDAATGALTFVESESRAEGIRPLRGATSVAVSPDSAHIYVAASLDDAVSVFRRDAEFGGFQFLDAEVDGESGVLGLDGASAVAVSPDGRHVYVTGSNDDSVVVFERDAPSGVLFFIQWKQDGLGGVNGLFGATDVVVSPDGAHVYVAGRREHAVAMFRRDATSGSLTYLGSRRDGEGAVSGLQLVSSLAVSPDGVYVLAGGLNANAVVVFARDPATGLLDFVQVERDGEGGVDGLADPIGIAVAAGGHTYVAGRADNAVALFVPEPGVLQLGLAAFVTLGLLRGRRQSALACPVGRRRNPG